MLTVQMSKIAKETLIQAPRSRVWRALTTPAEFAAWFHVKLSVAEFRAGERVDLVSTYPGHEGIEFFFEVVEIAPERAFVWRWRPSDKSRDSEPYTTVRFELEDTEGGTRLRVTESGFDQISLPRRAKAFESNTQGWQIQVENIRKYVEEK